MPENELWEGINKETEILHNLKPMREREGHTVPTCLYSQRKYASDRFGEE